MKLRLMVMVLGAAAAGCADEETEYTEGSQGKLGFSYEGFRPIGEDCFIDCAIDRPLLAGATEKIVLTSLTDEPHPYLHAASSNPRVLSIVTHAYTCCNSGCTDGDHYDECLAQGKTPGYGVSIEATGTGDGKAHLVLFSDTDPLYDELEITVRQAASLEIQTQPRRAHNDFHYETVDEVRLRGSALPFRVIAHDRAGNALFGNLGIQLAVEGDLAQFANKMSTSDRGYATLTPLARGTTTMHVTTSGASVDVPVISE